MNSPSAPLPSSSPLSVSGPAPLPWMGWREWVSFPDLGGIALKAKVDTGARTSALHVVDLVIERRDQRLWACFGIHPRRGALLLRRCCLPVIDERVVTDSGGHRERRAVIETRVTWHHHTWPVEITLTRRDTMRFRLLLGRTAINQRFLVDPSASYLGGKPVHDSTPGSSP